MDDIRKRFNTQRGNYGLPPRQQSSKPQPKPQVSPPAPQKQARPRFVGRPSQDIGPSSQPAPSKTASLHGVGPFAQKQQSAQPQATKMNQVSRQQKQQSSPFTTPPKIAKKYKKRKKGGFAKKFGVALAAMIILAGLGGGGFYIFNARYNNNQQANEQTDSGQVAGTSLSVAQQQTDAAPTPTGTITMLMTGDFIAYDSVNQRAKNGDTYNYVSMMTPMKEVFDAYDLRLCQQTTLGGGVELGVAGYPIFNAPLEWNSGLISQGCNLVATASRNAADKGQQAINNAADFYAESSVLAHSGVNKSADTAGVRYFEHQQMKFAFISYATDSIKKEPSDFSVNTYSKATATKQLGEARDQADFVIVAINWGNADDGAVQSSQRTIAQELTTAGADLIVGSGPHITQSVEILEGKEGRQSLVWYSLGNALSSQLGAENRIGGVAVVNIDIATGNMTDPGFLPTYMHYEWTAAQKASNDFDARKNLKWYPLDQAQSALGKSLLGTSIDAQVKRLEAIITKDAPIQMLTTADLKDGTTPEDTSSN